MERQRNRQIDQIDRQIDTKVDRQIDRYSRKIDTKVVFYTYHSHGQLASQLASQDLRGTVVEESVRMILYESSQTSQLPKVPSQTSQPTIYLRRYLLPTQLPTFVLSYFRTFVLPYQLGTQAVDCSRYVQLCTSGSTCTRTAQYTSCTRAELQMYTGYRY